MRSAPLNSEKPEAAQRQGTRRPRHCQLNGDATSARKTGRFPGFDFFSLDFKKQILFPGVRPEGSKDPFGDSFGEFAPATYRASVPSGHPPQSSSDEEVLKARRDLVETNEELPQLFLLANQRIFIGARESAS
jgi:hypothetical protein